MRMTEPGSRRTTARGNGCVAQDASTTSGAESDAVDRAEAGHYQKESLTCERTVMSIARGTLPIERQKDIDFMLAAMKKLLSQRQERERQLRARESEISRLMASEQGRWADFNERLDKLEQSLSSGVPKR